MTYKLTYFNITGLGEPIRLLLHQSGIQFEDIRINYEEWPKIKPTMKHLPMGQLPVLEFDGKVYHQSKAIARFVAKKGNLYGSDEIEAMEIDAVVETMDDLRTALSTFFWEQNAEYKEKLKEIAYQKLPVYLEKLETQVKNNNGYFVRGKLSWPDVLWIAYTDYLSHVHGEDINKNHPGLKKLVEKVRALPKIKAYLDKRPKTKF